MALCLLVLVFSFAAKLSWYQPTGTQIQALSSSKMWQHEAKVAAAIMAEPGDAGVAAAAPMVVISVLFVAVARLIQAPVQVKEWLEREGAAAFQQLQLAPVSLLRAPPVR